MRYGKNMCGIVAIGVVASLAQADLDDPLFKLLPSDGLSQDQFGFSVGISGTRAIVGAPEDWEPDHASGSAFIFDTTTAQQLFKLLPDDGEEDDEFGYAVAIDGIRAIIGAPEDRNDSNVYTGSAYLFDATTGLQIGAKLLANDGGHRDEFGTSVAISATRAIVGAPRDDDNGSFSGSAYLFDATTGLQIGAKLLPSDGAADNRFGFSVGISATRAIVGARRNDANGSDSGSAYLFDVTTGQQIGDPLSPDDGAAGDEFGYSVAISGTRAIIGAPRDDDNGTSSGSAYLFDTTTGQQIVKLLPTDGAEFAQFGYSVAISGITAIVGAFGDSDNGRFSGSAYLFDATTGVQIAKLLPIDGAQEDQFGYSVAISDVRAIIGAPGNADNGFNSGSAYITATDTDRDGLLDYWEDNGIPYVDGAGVQQHFMLPGADPMHKDLYVEVDEAPGFLLRLSVRQRLVDAFADAPVENPDGSTGIALHILRDDLTLPIAGVWATTDDWPTDYQTIRRDWFGTDQERQDALAGSEIVDTKAKAYRYSIIADRLDNNVLGAAEDIPSDDFITCLGESVHNDGIHDADDIAATWMHELGHCIGLGHGGGDDILGKPNYPSIMNYMYADKLDFNERFWALDYSRTDARVFAMLDLDESALSEPFGIPSGGLYDAWVAPFGITTTDGREVLYVHLDGRPTDFGTLGDIDGDVDGLFDDGVAQDLNYIGPDLPISGGDIPSSGETLRPYDDWQNLIYGVVDGSGNNSPRRGGELTSEAVEWINANFPLPPRDCPADIDGDGDLDAEDFFAYLDLFAAGDAGADIDGDGDIDAEDFFGYLDLFVMGC